MHIIDEFETLAKTKSIGFQQVEELAWSMYEDAKVVDQDTMARTRMLKKIQDSISEMHGREKGIAMFEMARTVSNRCTTFRAYKKKLMMDQARGKSICTDITK